MAREIDEEEFWAHTHSEAGERRVHSLREHLERVGEIAGGFAARFGAHEWAALAGRWHDLGKYGEAFQRYIRESSEPSEAHVDEGDSSTDGAVSPGRRRVDHSTAGAKWALEWAQSVSVERSQMQCVNAVAWAIAGHHAGLSDRADLLARLQSRGTARLAEVRDRAPDDLQSASRPEQVELVMPEAEPRELQSARMRQWEFWTRMLFSSLCDADFLDTESFFDASRSDARRGADVSMAALSARLREQMQAIEAGAREGSVSTVRRDVRQACLVAASKSPGIFSLTVPTGGGKTLASLSFALEHAATHGMDRVVVAIPFTSITEQSADAYRTALSDESSIVLEHHSAFDDALLVSRRRASGAGSRAIFRETSWNRLASENWDAPLVVTTTVQLFESLFSNRSGRCRKLHRLARSVIVLDEAQTVPVRYLDAILDVLKTLVRDYGASVVLCTATQPAWGPAVLGARGISAMHEIYPAHREAFSALRRVRVQWPSSLEPTPYEKIARELAARDDAMAIVHLRDDARTLCTLVDEVVGDDRCVHLSALMCAEHRRAVLRSVRERKSRREPVRLVATQLVEAGVDLDFAVVFRAMAGLDALAQAAGRCNREGLLGVEGGLLRVFVAETDPPRGPLQDGLAVARTMLAIAQSEGRTLDLFDPEIVREYFTRYYRATSTDHDKREIQALRAAWDFATVAEQVRIIDEWAVPVVVPWGEGPSLLTGLQRAIDAGAPPGRWLRKLQGYSVNVRRDLVDKWLKEAKVVAVGECALAIPSVFRGAYTERFGLDVEQLGVVSVSDTVL